MGSYLEFPASAHSNILLNYSGGRGGRSGHSGHSGCSGRSGTGRRDAAQA